MEIKINEANSKSLNKEFIELPWSLYKKCEHWIAPLKLSLYEMFSAKNPFLENAQMKRWLAYKNNKCVGRIAAIINQTHNQAHEEKVGFFGFYEAIDDLDVSSKLLITAKDWIKENNMELMRGPMNPSTNHECGLLIDGYEDDPIIMMPYNHPYYKTHFEKENFVKAKDLISYELPTKGVMPEKIQRVVGRLQERSRAVIRPIKENKFEEEMKKLFEIYNDAWSDNWGFIPFSEKEFKKTVDEIKLIYDKNLIYFCEIDNEPIGFVVALPDINQILKKIPSGRLFPTGIFKLLFMKKKIDRLRVIIMGVKKKYQIKGISTLLYNHLREETTKRGQYLKGELGWVLEDNEPMTKPLVLMGAKPYKRYRVYEKNL